MLVSLMKSKLHRASVTDANIHYEGSISICPKLCEAAQLFKNEKVDVLNINNGARLTTYVIYGKEGDICLNGAAARLCQPGDRVIIASYAQMSPEEAHSFEPRVILLNEKNEMQTHS